jgi:IS30 family transposase
MAKKSYHHVTRDQRSQIQVLKSTGESQQQIANHLGINQSSISRELSRNSLNNQYVGVVAQELSVKIPKLYYSPKKR